MLDDARYSLTELADLAGVTPRTVRFYLSQGLLPSPGATGPGVTYGAGSLDRLRLIRRLQREHLPLAEIRRQLAGLDDDAIAQLVDAAASEDGSASTTEPADSALDYVRRLLAPPATRPPMLRRSLMKRIDTVAESPALYASAMSVAPATPSSEPPAIERSQWERIALAEDVELHVRRPLPRSQSRKVDRLVTIARELLEEDPS
jgi:DNA-binding transcriptional MerR regulator